MQVVLLVLVLVHLRCLLLLLDVDGVATFFMLSWKAAADDDDDGTTAKAARHTVKSEVEHNCRIQATSFLYISGYTVDPP